MIKGAEQIELNLREAEHVRTTRYKEFLLKVYPYRCFENTYYETLRLFNQDYDDFTAHNKIDLHHLPGLTNIVRGSHFVGFKLCRVTDSLKSWYNRAVDASRKDAAKLKKIGTQMKKYLVQIVSFLWVWHDSGRLSNDIEPHHIYIGEDGHLKFVNYQWAQDVENKAAVKGSGATQYIPTKTMPLGDRRWDLWMLTILTLEAVKGRLGYYEAMRREQINRPKIIMREC